MTTTHPSMEELTSYGIAPEDEQAHPFAPDEYYWNESLFYDWYDDAGDYAGHCRIGVHPNQGRVFLWFYLWDGASWVAVEEARLPLAELDLARWSYDAHGLSFERVVVDPLKTNTLIFRGVGRVISGPKSGEFVPVSCDLRFDAIGPCHSVGASGVAGHDSEAISTNRFEQPVRVTGQCTLDGETKDLVGRGERDHSWGPRYWNMEWYFMAVNGPSFRMQCVRVILGEDYHLDVGYLSTEGTKNIEEVDFDIEFDDENVEVPWRGKIRAVTEDGEEVRASIEPITATSMDISHCFDPPQPSSYRRALIRFTPEGGEPMLGWMEINRFPNGMIESDE